MKIVVDSETSSCFCGCMTNPTTPNETAAAGHSRAAKGGEYGANGEWYEGGKFINTVPENAKRHGSRKRNPVRKCQVAPYIWEIQPLEGARPIFDMLSGFELFDRATKTFRLNTDLRGDWQTRIAQREEMIARYNSGEKWV